MEKDVSSVLRLNKLVFDEITFKRMGMKNENEVEYRMKIEISQKQDEEKYKVTLDLTGIKEKEYMIEIKLSGYFYFNTNEQLDESFKKTMINENAVAIMMPYLRSQVSLLTAQPEVDCVVLPPFNIVNMMSNDR